MRNHLIGSALLLLSAGCSLAPAHTRPEMPTPEQFPAYSPDAAGIDAATLGWSEYFVDPRLKALLAQALEGNRDLRIAMARIDEARGLYRIEASARVPNVGVSADASQTGGGSLATTDRYAVQVAVPAFELDLWGRVRNLSEAARAQYLATVQGQRAVRLSLIGQVAFTYFGWLEAQERIALAERTLTTRREGLEIATTRFEAGLTSALDYRQSEALLTQAETELAGLRLAEARANHALMVLVGGALPGELPLPVPLDSQFVETPLAAGLPSALLTVRPDIIAAEERLRAARANIGVARAAFFPSISLTGLFGFASDALNGLFDGDNEVWTYGSSVTAPIFSGGRLKGNLQMRNAQERIAVAEYEQAIQQAFREVADGLAGRRLLAEQVSSQRRATEAQREIAALARIRYDEGVSRYLEVLDAERSVFGAEQALMQLRRLEAENLVSLYLALGGGNLAE